MRGFGGIALKIWLCAAIGQMLTLLAFFNGLDEARITETRQRLTTLVTRVAQPASASAALGFPLDYHPELQRIIDDLAGGARLHDEVYILDAGGTVLFSSERSAIGTLAAKRWQLQGMTGGDRWTLTTPTEILVGLPVVNAISTRVGSIIARASRENMMLDVFSTLGITVGVSLVFLALAGVLGALGTNLATRGLMRRLDQLTRRYGAAATQIRNGLPPETTDDHGSMEAVAEAIAAFNRIEAAGHAIDHDLSRPKAAATAPGHSNREEAAA